MRYKKDDDNRYRVNFMRATEELMDAFTVKQFISYLEENAEFEDNDTIYLDGHVVNTKIYILYETKNLAKEFIITEDGRLFYWLSVIQKIELVDEETKTEPEVKPKNIKKMCIRDSYGHRMTPNGFYYVRYVELIDVWEVARKYIIKELKMKHEIGTSLEYNYDFDYSDCIDTEGKPITLKN